MLVDLHSKEKVRYVFAESSGLTLVVQEILILSEAVLYHNADGSSDKVDNPCYIVVVTHSLAKA